MTLIDIVLAVFAGALIAFMTWDMIREGIKWGNESKFVRIMRRFLSVVWTSMWLLYIIASPTIWLWLSYQEPLAWAYSNSEMNMMNMPAFASWAASVGIAMAAAFAPYNNWYFSEKK